MSTSNHHPALDRAGACSGVLFAVVLFVAAGDGSQGFSTPRSVAALAAITLALPFLAHVGALLQRSGGAGWTAPAVLAGGVAGVTLKLSSEVPAIAAHRMGSEGSAQLTQLTDALAGAATVASLDAFAVCCAAVAIGGLLTRSLPRWVCAGAGVTAVALVVNGFFLSTDFVVAFLLFNVWSFATGVHLLRRAGRLDALAGEPAVAAPGRSA
ncbi:MAG TPA: hypothetical protein VFV89_06080 [Nocardioides sp.]|uniref:hypothetical protein n=1 Tax=Nocardioides sp. TaxID=35761 RepID=UPI002E36273F|nr:hypothetical protein [Nocardioides sp.]HEX5087357.1 hypothetical protein [Nocardioides sp.]